MEQDIITTFSAKRWEETEIAPVEGHAKLTRASCEQTYTGDVEGTSTLEYTMVYAAGGAATFVGLERVVGTVAGREGSFVLRHFGSFEQGVANMALEVVDGAGTGQLSGLSGRGSFTSGHAASYSLTLRCRFGE